ncbi:MerR family transcriptional regulator [Nocardia brevicatena]|uniref:MerR family transcriptional regulator n=1 Tax=Nocardia brevicatena TaxID=37327 RepID=UPI0002DB7AE4|nr:MerR family transcriptional regulator [Nocardia brevicatena]
MLISELAKAARTTPRAVRHYHRLGLLAEPARGANGYRRYTLEDLTRLMRIRWLADNGLPLGSVAAVLADDRTAEGVADIRADLEALIAGCERDIALLTTRRQRLTRMLECAAAGVELSALPRGLVEVFETVRAETVGEAEIRALERERDFLEALAISGNTPDQLFDWFARTLGDPGRRGLYRSFLRAWEVLAGRSANEVAAEIERLARELAGDLRETFTASVPAGAAGDSGLEDIPLSELVPDAAQRRVVVRAVELFSADGEG